MIVNPNIRKSDWTYDDFVDTMHVKESKDLSEAQRKKIIADLGVVFEAKVEITELEETLNNLGDSFKKHVKSDLSRKITEAIYSKASFTQQQVAGPMPITRVKAKVIVMSEEEMMNLINLIRNY